MQRQEQRVNSQELTIEVVKLFNIFAGTNYSQRLKNQYQLWEEIITINKPQFIKFLTVIQDIPEFQKRKKRYQQEILKHKQIWIDQLKKGKKLYKLRDKPLHLKHKNACHS